MALLAGVRIFIVADSSAETRLDFWHTRSCIASATDGSERLNSKNQLINRTGVSSHANSRRPKNTLDATTDRRSAATAAPETTKESSGNREGCRATGAAATTKRPAKSRADPNAPPSRAPLSCLGAG